ncbi:MAG: hypothetical protein QOJ52_3710 [Acidimicrobiaceae bacterium]|jgi:hypothetical protein|nr:hypothetical protein [Acidimicrobiaceae bacterium]MDQ1377775.1 hypothetical protein [Acidimicrobiaceae bacterium]MDQ1421748.1 hypothetical protein [Acidimicrobiaceae bacterium]
MRSPDQTTVTKNGAPRTDIGELVIGAADGDCQAWDELVASYSDLVSSITAAHRLNVEDAARVQSTVWIRLGRNLGKIRQPDRVGTWLGAVARDECVKVLTTPKCTAA